MSSDFNFTVTSWFLGNVRVKPYFNTQWGGAPPVFDKSLNPLSTRGADYAHHSTTSPPGFSDLSTALLIVAALPANSVLLLLCKSVSVFHAWRHFLHNCTVGYAFFMESFAIFQLWWFMMNNSWVFFVPKGTTMKTQKSSSLPRNNKL